MGPHTEPRRNLHVGAMVVDRPSYPRDQRNEDFTAVVSAGAARHCASTGRGWHTLERPEQEGFITLMAELSLRAVRQA